MTRPELENKVDNFVGQFNGRGVDFDGAYGFQCMDEAEEYNRDVVGAPRIGGDAIDTPPRFNRSLYDWIDNTPTNVPAKGDIMVWGSKVGQYGHIAVFVNGNVNSFVSFDQNWPLGSVCHQQSHNYNGVLGWARPKTSEPAPPPPPPAPLPPEAPTPVPPPVTPSDPTPDPTPPPIIVPDPPPTPPAPEPTPSPAPIKPTLWQAILIWVLKLWGGRKS